MQRSDVSQYFANLPPELHVHSKYGVKVTSARFVSQQLLK